MTAVVLIRFSLLGLRRAIRASEFKDSVYFFDLYSRSNGLLVTFLARLVGPETASRWIERLGPVLGRDLRRMPHGDAVKDYHVLQLCALRDARDALSRFHGSADYRCDIPIPPGILEDDCADSLYLKTLGRRLWHVFENVNVLKNLGAREIALHVETGAFPEPLLTDISRIEGVSILRVRPRGRLLPLVVFGSLMAVRLSAVLFRVRPAVRPDESAGPGPFVAVEFVDPRCNSGRATEPNYIARGDFPRESIIAYYRSTQRRRLRTGNFSLNASIPVVGLHGLPVAAADAAVFARACARVLAGIWRNTLPVYGVIKALDDLELFLELSSLFRRYPVRVHIYNKLPNGRSDTRHDSGLVTGVCRKFAVHSLSYQSRIYYQQNVYYFFDAFDEFCMWGESWVEEYGKPQFIKKFTVIGNVHLDSYFDRREETGDLEELGDARKLVVLTGDLDRYHPLHYTFDYTRRFLTDTFLAVGEYNRSNPDRRFEIVLKTKDPQHSSELFRDPEISEALEKSGVRLIVLKRARHDVESVIRAADKVMAIGFTSPGFDALGLGKPSVYYTPYRFRYNRMFDENSPLVVRDPDGINAFLASDGEVNPRFLDGLDPFRDGQAAVRLGSRVRSLLGRGQEARD